MFSKVFKHFKKSNLNFLEGFNIKRILPIAALAIADAGSFALPFYLKNVFPGLAGAMGITESQYSQLLAIYGFVCIGSYLPGGWLADRLNSKTLLLFSLLLTGIVGIWYSTIGLYGSENYLSNKIPNFISNGTNYHQYYQLMAIYILWGISTVLLLWAPLWKLLSQQGNKKEQGTVNGILGSINGLTGAIMIGVAYGFYAWNPIIFGFKAGFLLLGIILSFIPLVTIIFVFLSVKEKIVNRKFALKLDELFKFAKDYKVWLVALLVMSVYMYQTGLTFFINYMANSLKIVAGLIVALGIIRTYLFRFVASPFAGKIADRSKSYILFISIGLTLAIVVNLIAALAPGFNTNFKTMSSGYRLFLQILIVTTFLILGFITWCLVTNRWATITEIGVKDNNYATVTGFVSLIALSPDGWFFQITSAIQSHYQIAGPSGEPVTSLLGNQIILLTLCGVAAIGTVAGYLLYIIAKKQDKLIKVSKELQILEPKNELSLVNEDK